MGPIGGDMEKRQTEPPSSTVSFMRTVKFAFLLVTCSAIIISLIPSNPNQQNAADQ